VNGGGVLFRSGDGAAVGARHDRSAIPISMPVVLPPDCYEFFVEVFADTNGAVPNSGNAAASNVVLSP
jgi:hypothetical protein